MRVPIPLLRLLDALAFSGVWAGGVATALTWASGVALGSRPAAQQLVRACLLAGAGTVVVYAIDRLRDVERDRATAPARSDFVATHRTGMIALTITAAVLCVPAAAGVPARVWALCAAVLLLGLLHRRLKARPTLAPWYVSGAWTAIVVGIPALLGPADAGRAIAALIAAVCIALAIAGNVVASDLRGRRFDADGALRLRGARRLALLAAVAPIGFASLRALGLVGVTTWLALVFFRPEERFGLIVLDGALLVGGLLAGAGLAGH